MVASRIFFIRTIDDMIMLVIIIIEPEGKIMMSK